MGALLGCERANHPPLWSAAPQLVEQGETLLLPVTATDADADTVTVSVDSAPDGLEAAIDGDSLSLHPRYQLTGTQSVVVKLDDHHGGVVRVPVEVDVVPIGWQWTTSFTDGPTAREHGTFVVDAERDLVHLIGGSGYVPQGTAATDAYWTFDLVKRTWSPLVPTGDVPPPAASRRAAALPDQKVALLFGGYETDASDNNDLYRFDYSSSPPSFKKLAQENPPPARELHAFAYDPGSDTFITFGGFSSMHSQLDDTWTMKLSGDTATWSQLPASGPSKRYGFFYGLDPATGTLYVWSGAQKPAGSDPINGAKDTWALDLRANPPAWSQVLDGSEPNAPIGRRNGAFVFDPSGPRLVVFGGTADGATTVPGLSFLDLRPGKLAWDTVTLPAQPALRSSCFGFFDGKRQQSVLGFGNDRALYRDLSAIGY